MWNLPGRGIEPTSPALAGGFLSTESPGKSVPKTKVVILLSEAGERGVKQVNINTRLHAFKKRKAPWTLKYRHLSKGSIEVISELTYR